MNTQKTVNERIAKVALKNQEVNLGLAQDLLQEYKKAVNKFTDAASTMDRALEMLKSAKKNIRRYRAEVKRIGCRCRFTS